MKSNIRLSRCQSMRANAASHSEASDASQWKAVEVSQRQTEAALYMRLEHTTRIWDPCDKPLIGRARQEAWLSIQGMHQA